VENGGALSDSVFVTVKERFAGTVSSELFERRNERGAEEQHQLLPFRVRIKSEQSLLIENFQSIFSVTGRVSL
jgi:hypothetical protein